MMERETERQFVCKKSQENTKGYEKFKGLTTENEYNSLNATSKVGSASAVNMGSSNKPSVRVDGTPTRVLDGSTGDPLLTPSQHQLTHEGPMQINSQDSPHMSEGKNSTAEELSLTYPLAARELVAQHQFGLHHPQSYSLILS